MKKNQLKKLVMAGLVAGTVIASQAVVNANEGESVMIAGAACGGGCGGQKRNLTTDNTAPQAPTMQRPATQEEIDAYRKANPSHNPNVQYNQNPNAQYTQNPNAQYNQNPNVAKPQGSCNSANGCKGNGNPANNGSCSANRASR